MRNLKVTAAAALLAASAGFLLVLDGRPEASTRPYVIDADPAVCAAKIAYLEKHADPHYAIECPDLLPGNEVSATCLPQVWPECWTPVIKLTAAACPTAVQDEASNSWVLWAYSSSGQIPPRVLKGGVPDYPGQYGMDNYGEC